MADPPLSPDTPDEPGMPRWVKLSGIIVIGLVLLVVILNVTGVAPGGHGPGRHLPGGDKPGGHTPPSSVKDHTPSSGDRRGHTAPAGGHTP
jgi:hypothetical protein